MINPVNYLSNSRLYCTIDSSCSMVDAGDRIICNQMILEDCAGRSCSNAVVDNGLLACDCDSNWNCGLCGNDQPYFMPVVPGDDLFFQFQQIDTLNGVSKNTWTGEYGWMNNGNADAPTESFITGSIYDCCSNEPLLNPDTGLPIQITTIAAINPKTSDQNAYVGLYYTTDHKGVRTFHNIQGIQVNTELLKIFLDALAPENNNGCFYFKFCFYPGRPEEYCLCTQPYKFVKCENNNTITVQGSYSKLDCNGYFYGMPGIANGGVFNYVGWMRIPASFESLNFEIGKEKVGVWNRTVSSESSEVWLLRSKALPFQVAKLYANYLAAETIYINEEEFQFEGEIAKNNEIGLRWWIDGKFTRIICKKSFSC